MLWWFGWGILACFRSRASLVAENVCLRQQLLVLQRRQPRPRMRDADRRFWVLACRWFAAWRGSLLIVKPETVLRWHRRGWRAYWRWRSRPRGKVGRRPISAELRVLIQRMATENPLWGQRRIYAELRRLGFRVSARTVAKYMPRPHDRGPSPGWRAFLKQNASAIWACDFLCVQTIFLLQDAVCVLHYRSRQPGSAPRPGDAPSHGRMGSPANGRMLRMGPRGAALLDS